MRKLCDQIYLSLISTAFNSVRVKSWVFFLHSEIAGHDDCYNSIALEDIRHIFRVVERRILSQIINDLLITVFLFFFHERISIANFTLVNIF